MDEWNRLMATDLSRTVFKGARIFIDGSRLGVPAWGCAVITRHFIRLEPMRVWHRGKWLLIEQTQKHPQLYEAIRIINPALR
jgi:hypothetical protein